MRLAVGKDIPDARGYFFSMPLVVPAPGLVAQQKTESSPHFSQVCLTSSCLPFPMPTTVMVLLQPGQVCFSPTVMILICPFSVSTRWIMTDLHLVHTIASSSPGLRASASASVLMPVKWSRCGPPFICSAAWAAPGSPAVMSVASARPEYRAIALLNSIVLFIYVSFGFLFWFTSNCRPNLSRHLSTAIHGLAAAHPLLLRQNQFCWPVKSLVPSCSFWSWGWRFSSNHVSRCYFVSRQRR